MANITISDLRPAGADLFSDSESYLNELTESEINSNIGGLTPIVIRVVIPLVIRVVIKIGK
ncbi:hypothetical protein [Cylindrospermopsis raciborskii]|uniref:Bacteriocin n=1 Tax=Cylindrospermopsis raciborskii CENA302 TaxID=1170768 RepID=A0A9Q5QXT0_9CYAN|nr:hypothetical protein [Cylindrospermopsis raciborskii]OPH10523.1 hypothetical protein CENA302_05260 [Cylindrospermopsis raciborskii CENA302]